MVESLRRANQNREAKKSNSRSPKARRSVPSTIPKVAVKKFPYEFTTLKQRQESVVMPDGYKPDNLLESLLKNAETLYEPKKVYTPSDWLVT